MSAQRNNLLKNFGESERRTALIELTHSFVFSPSPTVGSRQTKCQLFWGDEPLGGMKGTKIKKCTFSQKL